MKHLYVHVPFCLRRCSYCDFAVQPTRRPATRLWLEAVTEELRLARQLEGWPQELQLSTIYLGGGTPSLLDPGMMLELRGMLERAGGLNGGLEWTAEANPESFTQVLAHDWLSCGVNRISLGIQSFHAPSLRWMGRLHGADGAQAALQTARAAGFDNVSVDLIFGLPEHLKRDWRYDLEQALRLEPDHVSLYGLTAESGAALGRWVREGRATMTTEETYADEYLLAAEVLTAAGFEHYEVSNFARPGRASSHNYAYWNGASYLGLGPGAHSYHAPDRFWNVRDWAEYQRRIAAGQLAREGREVLDVADQALERVWLGLRTSQGAELPDASETLSLALRQWQAAGWARLEGGTVRLTPAGWLLLDKLAVEWSAAAST